MIYTNGRRQASPETEKIDKKDERNLKQKISEETTEYRQEETDERRRAKPETEKKGWRKRLKKRAV